MEKHEIYKCDECKQVVEVTVGGDKPIFCCGKEMQKLIPQTAEYKLEKHVPYPEATPNGMRVLVVKELSHPMTDANQIFWFEVINGPYVNRKYLKPGEKPEAEFYVPIQTGMIIREYCNIHGLWESIVK